jgi:hypothetical protein
MEPDLFVFECFVDDKILIRSANDSEIEMLNQMKLVKPNGVFSIGTKKDIKRYIESLRNFEKELTKIAADASLDKIGDVLAVKRKQSEPDAVFRERLLAVARKGQCNGFS